ncbi:MAG: DUF2490 domain-containing protein [Polyangiaceae bacterium]
MRNFLFLGALCAVMFGLRAANADTRTETQYWTAAFLTARITGEKAADPGLSGWFDLHGRFGEDRTTAIVRPGLGYRFSGLVSGWAGYAWVPTWIDDAPTIQEHRIWEQGIVQGAEGILRYQIRPRFEQRFREGQDDVGLRLRLFLRSNLRLTDELPLDIAIWDEVFVGLNETAWGQVGGFDQNRIFVGPAYTFGPARLEAGYLNVVIRRPGGSWVVQHNPLVAVVVSF